MSRWYVLKPKDLRTRLGEDANFPTVEDAVALLKGGGVNDQALSVQIPNKQHARALEEHDRKRTELVARQLQERKKYTKPKRRSALRK